MNLFYPQIAGACAATISLAACIAPPAAPIQMAEVGMSPQMFARHPVADRSAAGTTRANMRGQRDRMRQAATAKVCLGLAK
jgi:hypothetical protein